MAKSKQQKELDFFLESATKGTPLFVDTVRSTVTGNGIVYLRFYFTPPGGKSRVIQATSVVIPIQAIGSWAENFLKSVKQQTQPDKKSSSKTN